VTEHELTREQILKSKEILERMGLTVEESEMLKDAVDWQLAQEERRRPRREAQGVL
jgi:hypothetical protein